jgi:hypothetical protein
LDIVSIKTQLWTPMNVRLAYVLLLRLSLTVQSARCREGLRSDGARPNRGEATGFVARSFKISAARVSQLRRDLCDSWHRFVGELSDLQLASIAVA